MFKKRPRQLDRRTAKASLLILPSKMEPAYWEKRLFKNTFTYKGSSRRVNAWCVKMQLFGRRKTFSLSSSDRAKAAIEASHIFQTINDQGWDAVGQRRGRTGFPAIAETTAPAASGTELDVESWKSRLIHRRYPEPATPEGRGILSVRIEHSGISRYFPLGTSDENQAAMLARKIHQTVVHQGWGIANPKFSRELTLAFRWLEDPLAWTYTTLYTRAESNASVPVVLPNEKTATRWIAVIEADPGIRNALADCVNSQEGFACCATYSSVAEAVREMTRRRIDMVIINYALPDQPGANCLAALQKEKPGVVGVLYSVFEDSDQLFKSTPGGAAGYLLKRTPTHRIFDPIVDASEPLTREFIAFKIREYFQRLIAAMPSGPSALEMAKLTPREHEVLTLLAKGDLAKEIADSLGISIWTVHGHVKSIFEKFNVHTRTEAVVKFLQK